MPEYAKKMTVRQLIDLVAYLHVMTKFESSVEEYGLQ